MILSDSTSAAIIAINPMYLSKTKHFEVDLYFIGDKVTRGELWKSFVAGWDQIAGVLTKPLHYCKFSHFRSKLKVLDKTLNIREDVESCSCGKSIVDFEAKLAYHLSYSYLQPADMGNELDLLSWQNGYTKEYQHMSIEG